MRRLIAAFWLLSIFAVTACFAQGSENRIASTVQRLNGYSQLQIDYTFIYGNKYKIFIKKRIDGSTYEVVFFSDEVNVTSLNSTELKIYCKDSNSKCIEIKGPERVKETSYQVIGSRNARDIDGGMNDLFNYFESDNQDETSVSKVNDNKYNGDKSDKSYSTSGAKSIIQLNKTESGVYKVPVEINDVLEIHMILDSGASEGSISPDVALTLIRTGTIDRNDWLPSARYTFANGETTESSRFEIDLKLGGQLVEDVAVSISNNIEAPLLLGQNTLSQFGSVKIDYESDRLIIK